MIYIKHLTISLIFALVISIPAIALDDYEPSTKKQEEEEITIGYDLTEAARSLGYEEESKIIQLVRQERKEELQSLALQKQMEAAFEIKRQEYPEATYIWEYLQDYGYSDYVCAGIMGNIMVEVGGYTLAVQPYIGSGYVGICQWSVRYWPQAVGLSLEEQCTLLTDTIEDEFAAFGYIYQSGFSYEAFQNMTSCEDIALAFAKVYERCGSGSYSIRQECALTAYSYFTNTGD